MSIQNIVLIGMTGSGQSVLGKLLSSRLGKVFVDTDALVEAAAGLSIAAIFAEHGEAEFRRLESLQVQHCSERQGLVIATGGGIVLDPGNVTLLKKHGRLYYLQRELNLLARQGRPLSCSAAALMELFERRAPLYLKAADCLVDNNADIETALQQIMDDYRENTADQWPQS